LTARSDTPLPAERKTISIVIPCYNEAEAFARMREALVALADSLEPDFNVELVFIDDGSRDHTWRAISEFARDDTRVRGVALSRNFGHQFALTCGYDLARGDAVVSMDADLQDPPETVRQLIEQWLAGYDVVFAVRRQRAGESWFKLCTASCFYRLIRAMGAADVRANVGDFRLMSRAAVDALNRMREQHRFIRGMVGWVGFRTTEVLYDRLPRVAGETKYPLRKMVKLAIDAIISFSSVPLRVAYWTGVALMIASFAYLAYTVVQHWLFGVALVPGWSSLLVAVVAFGTMNLICLGLIGEYIGRIYEQSKQRPLYLIRDVIEATAGSAPSQSPGYTSGASVAHAKV
jgi:glycosyltransferase involved in cell wall biosynthesis